MNFHDLKTDIVYDKEKGSWKLTIEVWSNLEGVEQAKRVFVPEGRRFPLPHKVKEARGAK